MFPLVLTYVIDVSVTAALPDSKVTTGVLIVSLAVKVSVTTSATFASVVVELLDAIATLLKVGTVSSNVTPPPVTAVPAFDDKSLNAMLYVTDPSVSEASVV